MIEAIKTVSEYALDNGCWDWHKIALYLSNLVPLIIVGMRGLHKDNDDDLPFLSGSHHGEFCIKYAYNLITCYDGMNRDKNWNLIWN